MRSSRPISLFSQRSEERRPPGAYLVSFVVHGSVVGMIAYGVLFAPRINMSAAADRYLIRNVDLSEPDPPAPLPPKEDNGEYPRTTPQQTAPHGKLVAPSSSLRQLEKRLLAEKTVLQPDVRLNKLLLKTAPLPSMLIWSAQRPKVELITPPQPRKIPTSTIQPSIERPNMEAKLADMPVSSTNFATAKPMPVPGSSSPIVIRGPNPSDLVAETSSNVAIEPSSAAILSLSDLQMNQGTTAVPPANQTAKGDPAGALAPGKSGSGPRPGSGDANAKGLAANGNNSIGPAGKSGPGGSKSGAGAGTGEGNGVTFTRVNVPHDGQFNFVIVGSVLNGQFPQTTAVWGNRLVYSVYLHVGLSKSWILQYALPSSEDTMPGGSRPHIEAPWPFYIVRPNLEDMYINANALMIHGFVTVGGRFESLSLAFPAGFTEAQGVVEALQQWQFRPATENGQKARVEVLLIIPQGVD